MLQASWYLLKVILCSGILMGYYWFMLRNKIYHHYNRFFLLASVILSLTVPLLHINIWHYADAPKSQAIELLQAVTSSDDFVNELHSKGSGSYFTATQVLSVLYSLICIVFFILFIRVLWIIRTLIHKYKGQIVERFYFVNTDAKGTPFSFLNYIFWNDAIDMESSTGKQIFRHEVAHVQEKHSYDKLFMNIVLIVCWCNPFFWLLRKELNMIHEFIADKKAVEDNDTASFAAMILQAAYPMHRFELTNSFFYSPIKRRLLMLTKIQHPKVSYFSRILVLPLAVLVFAAFAFKTKTIHLPSQYAQSAAKQVTIVVDAGHGGKDGGAQSNNGAREKDMTLALVQKIKELNTNQALNIVLTRESDIYLSPQERAAIAKQQNAALFISIHLDASAAVKNETQKGMTVLIARDEFSNANVSRQFASALIGAFKNNYGLLVPDNPTQYKTGVWVLQANECPSVLIEAGNISDSKEAAYLQSAEGKEALARNVLAAIETYLQQPPQAPQPMARAAVATDTVPETNVTGQAATATITRIKQQTGKNPLVLLDGKEIKDISSVPADKIATIDVLKNERGVTLYGQKAKDGVVLITSKAGAEQKSQPVITITPGKKPLYALNGKILTEKEVNAVNVNDIAEVNVLKGDRARMLYGDVAVNGVVEIKTKPVTTMREVVAVSNPKAAARTATTVTINNKAENDLADVAQQGNPEEVFTKVEQEARFPGGLDAWRKYLEKNLQSNIPVKEGWKPGVYKVMVQFLTDEKGNIANVKTLNYANTKTAGHCIGIIKNGPKWEPAMQNGRKVKAYRNQPITFVVQ